MKPQNNRSDSLAKPAALAIVTLVAVSITLTLAWASGMENTREEYLKNRDQAYNLCIQSADPGNKKNPIVIEACAVYAYNSTTKPK